MRINTNMSALAAFNAFIRSNTAIDKTMQQLSTGLRINSAADDAAGLAISENLRAQSMGLDRAIHNTQDGISLIQTAEGALGETNSMLQRMRELSIQAANDTLTTQDRSYIQLEIEEIKAHIDRIASTTQFNERRILDGSICGTMTSTDSTTKGYVRGAITNEGNYRLEIKADPGQAQVQKTNIFKIKHEDVITNLQLNEKDGFRALKIDGLPAGDYAVSTSMGSGGSVGYKYDAVLEGEATEANGSGYNETMTLTFTSEDYMSASFSFELGSDLTTKEAVAQKVVDEINNKGSIMVGGREVALEAELKEDGTSYRIKASGLPHIVRMRSNVSVNTVTTVTPRNNKNCSSIPWKVFTVPQEATVDASINITYGSQDFTVDVKKGDTQQTIAQNVCDKLKEIGISGAVYNFLQGQALQWNWKLQGNHRARKQPRQPERHKSSNKRAGSVVCSRSRYRVV